MVARSRLRPLPMSGGGQRTPGTGRTSSANAREGWKRLGWAFLDGACWHAAVLAVWLYPAFNGPEVLRVHPVAVAVASAHLLMGGLLGPYLVRHIRGSFEEVVSLARACLLTGAAFLAHALVLDVVPPAVPVLSTALALTAMLAVRFALRSWQARRVSARPREHRAIVYGAGEAGRRLIRSLNEDGSTFVPVAVVDDDRGKRRLRVEGVAVRGGRAAIGELAVRYRATHLVVAIPGADAGLMRAVRAIGVETGLVVKVLPTIDRILGQDPAATDLRDINLEDLLGRRPVRLDESAIRDAIQGKVVLVTGAGGSIGSELCRQITVFGPSRLIMLDRDESALHAVQLSLTGRGLLEGDDLFLADIRDAATVRRLLVGARPDVVFHAAALKHLSLLEKHPEEAWKTNVIGTWNVLSAAAEAGVGTFVNISTDKAADPGCVLGYSKRIAERLTAHYGATQPGRYVSVRFGNVLGSRGSVIPAFTEQICRGGPVTVTHPEVERYFMLVTEACQLVLQASTMDRDGQVLVLEMGAPVRIADVASTLIQMSGRPGVDIVYTGLRPGEKLTESLFTSREEHRPTEHPLVRAVTVPPLAPSAVTIGSRAEWLRDWLIYLSESESDAAPPRSTAPPRAPARV